MHDVIVLDRSTAGREIAPWAECALSRFGVAKAAANALAARVRELCEAQVADKPAEGAEPALLMVHLDGARLNGAEGAVDVEIATDGCARCQRDAPDGITVVRHSFAT